jgi:hypothetical protein
MITLRFNYQYSYRNMPLKCVVSALNGKDRGNLEERKVE